MDHVCCVQLRNRFEILVLNNCFHQYKMSAQLLPLQWWHIKCVGCRNFEDFRFFSFERQRLALGNIQEACGFFPTGYVVPLSFAVPSLPCDSLWFHSWITKSGQLIKYGTYHFVNFLQLFEQLCQIRSLVTKTHHHLFCVISFETIPPFVITKSM